MLETLPSIANVYEDLFAQNCLLDRTQSAKIGVLDIAGNDPLVTRVEITASLSNVSDANLYLCGIVIRSTNGFYSDCIGEISDIGVHVTGNLNRLSNCRADLNLGHGFEVLGGNNQFSNCLGLNISQDTTNSYDNWRVSGLLNQFANCKSHNSVAKVARYGFIDLVTSATQKNRWLNPLHTGTACGTADYLTQTNNGSGMQFMDADPVSLTADSTTPGVAGLIKLRTANTVPTTISNFTGGVQGQTIHVFCNDSNTTIAHNGTTIALMGLGNLKLRSGVTYSFYKDGSIWREIGKFPLGVTADVGDAAKTLQARVDNETQVWNTPITADRAVTLSTTGAFAGAKFRIVRTANATGAFNLNVGTGPLKAMGTAGSFSDVEYNGSAWVLTAYGTL